MADAVTTNVLIDNATHYVAHFTNISDGTGEAAVKKIDKSAIHLASDGAEAASLDIEKIQWCCVGMYVKLLWDHSTDDFGFVCDGSGSISFKGDERVGKETSGLVLKDPRSAGDTGDILFTTVGHSSGDTYSITIWCRKQPD